MAVDAKLGALNRRSFLGGLAAVAATPLGAARAAAGQGIGTRYEVILKGGEVIDPSRNVRGIRDVAFAYGKVAAVAENIPAAEARDAYDVTGRLVFPGLVDFHAHFHWGTRPFLNPPRDFREDGVTAAADAGTDSENFYNLRDYIIKPAPLHLYAFLRTLLPDRYVPSGRERIRRPDPPLTVIRSNPEYILGTKIKLPSAGQPQDIALPMLDYGVQVAAEAGVPAMCHIDGGLPLTTVTGKLRPGDSITHIFQSKDPHILGADGKVRPEIWEARERGVYFDNCVGNMQHMSWRITEAAAEQGLWPDIISSDFPNPGPGGPSYTLPDCMSMMLGAGMDLDRIIAATTVTPAKAMRRADAHGSLAAGMPGDAAVFDLESGRFAYELMDGDFRTVTRRFTPVLTVIGGRVVWASRAGRDLRRVQRGS